MSMMLRRQMMIPKAGGGGLPAEYQQVAYLESTGTQYINTGVLFNAGIKILARMGWTTSHSIEALFGARTDSGSTRFFLSNYAGIDYAYGDDYTWGYYTAGAMYDFIFDTTIENTFIYGTTAETRSVTHSAINTNTSGYIFAYHRASDDTVQAYASAKCESLVIEDATGTKLRDMIPCIRIADSKPGMYDLVGRTFYTNQGTGEFIAGLAPDLSDADYWSIVGYFNASGTITSHLGYSMCDYQPIIGGNAYTFNLSNNSWKGLGFYDEQYNPLEFSQNANSTNPITITAPANTKYYRIYVNNTAQGIKFELVNPTQ